MPVLLHFTGRFPNAPPCAEATAFLAVSSFGLACPSLEPRAVIDTFERLIERIGGGIFLQDRETAVGEECRKRRWACASGVFERA